MDFTFRGIDISTYGFYYAPEVSDWHVWDNEYKTEEAIVGSQDGGQWYGSSLQPKAFILRCYFEDVAEVSMSAFINLFSRDAYGKLIFGERPWLTYMARVVKAPEIMKYTSSDGTLSGTVTMNLTAYYPFATTDLTTIESASAFSTFSTIISATTGLIAAANMPVNTEVAEDAKATAQFEQIFYNAGDATADTIIRIAGDVGTGVTIYNQETDQTCKVIGLTAANTETLNSWLEINSRTGECFITDGATQTSGYRYHDRSYINLAPSAPIQRAISIAYDGYDVVATTNIFSDCDIGKYMLIEGEYVEIITIVSPNTVITDSTSASTGTGTVDIITVNKITITPATTMSLSMFSVEFKSTFS